MVLISIIISLCWGISTTRTTFTRTSPQLLLYKGQLSDYCLFIVNKSANRDGHLFSLSSYKTIGLFNEMETHFIGCAAAVTMACQRCGQLVCVCVCVHSMWDHKSNLLSACWTHIHKRTKQLFSHKTRDTLGKFAFASAARTITRAHVAHKKSII